MSTEKEATHAALSWMIACKHQKDIVEACHPLSHCCWIFSNIFIVYRASNDSFVGLLGGLLYN